MTNRVNELFDNLMNLQSDDDWSKFMFKDFTTQYGTKVRIFSYNFASYSDWLLPDALESRGIMFELDENDSPVRIMSRPMEKFFNLDENPMASDLDFSKIEYLMTKEDGSLISTYVDNGQLFTKSKASINSTQAIESRQILLDIDFKDLYDRALELANDGFTCNLEYVAPHNRIVLDYDKKDLILLNVRHNDTGEYVSYEDLKADPVLRKYLVDAQYPTEEVTYDTIEEIRNMFGIEGFVFVLSDGKKFKLKTYWYSELHRIKDSLNNNEALFMTIAAGASDDIKSFYTDDWSKTKILTFETIFLDYMRESSKYVFDLQKQFTGLDRKDYAVKCQTKVKADNKLELFFVLMEMYKGADPDETVAYIIQTFMKNYKRFVPKEYDTPANLV